MRRQDLTTKKNLTIFQQLRQCMITTMTVPSEWYAFPKSATHFSASPYYACTCTVMQASQAAWPGCESSTRLALYLLQLE